MREYKFHSKDEKLAILKRYSSIKSYEETGISDGNIRNENVNTCRRD